MFRRLVKIRHGLSTHCSGIRLSETTKQSVMFEMTQRKFGIDGPNIEVADGYCSAGKDANKDIEVADGYCSAGKDANEVIKVAK